MNGFDCLGLMWGNSTRITREGEGLAKENARADHETKGNAYWTERNKTYQMHSF